MSPELMIADLIPMQAGFRRPLADLLLMGKFVAAGGIFDHEAILRHGGDASRLIAVVRFEDGRHYVRDGIHRVAGILLGRRDRVLPEEHRIEVMTYAMFQEPNLKSRFFTPFDPRRAVRRADFSGFVNRIDRLLEQGFDPVPTIRANRHEYSVIRGEQHASVTSLLRGFLISQRCEGVDSDTPLDTIGPPAEDRHHACQPSRHRDQS